MYPLKRFAFSGMLSFLLGLAAADAFGIQWGSLFLLALVFLLAAIFCRELTVKIILFSALTFALGFFYMGLHLAEVPLMEENLGQPKEMEILLKEIPQNRGSLYGELIALEGERLEKKVPLRVQKKWGDEEVYQRGGCYQFKGIMTKPLGAVNPGGFDDREFLKTRGIFYSVKATRTGNLVQAPEGLSLFFNSLREKFEAIYDHYLLQNESNLLKGALFGEKGALEDDFYALSQKMGIAHVFAVSGLHIGFLVGLCFLILRAFSLERSWFGIGLLLLLLGSYVFIVGGVPSAIRASVLVVSALILQKFLFYKDALTILGWVFFVLALFNPFVIWNIGAQLSFGIAISIIYVYPLLRTYLPQKRFQLFWDGIGISLASELVSIPLAAWYFYIWAPYGVLFNCFVIPLFSLLVPLAILALGAAFCFPILAKILFYFVHLLIQLTLFLISFVTGMIGSGHLYVGKPSALWLLVFLLGLLGVTLWSWRSRETEAKIKRLPPQVLLMTFVLLLVFMGRGAPAAFAFSVLDVGQGSSAVYQSPKGEWFVFDTGPSEDTTAQFLRYAACNKIKAVILSHGDSDHVRGLNHLLRDFKVEHLLVSEKILEAPAFEASLEALKGSSTKVHFIAEQEALKLGRDYSLTLDLVDKSGESNSHEVVAFLKEKDFSWLIPGDTEGRALKEILFPEPAQILLVPHHGSKNSWQPAFYERYQPELAVISAGRDNRFGHPHKQVTQGLDEMAISHLSTQESGAILFWREGKELVCEPFLEQALK